MTFSVGRRRRTASMSGSLPTPPSTTTTTSATSPQPPTPTRVHHNPRSRHQYSRSQQLPSTSLPFGSLFSSSPGNNGRGHHQHHHSLSISSSSSSGASEPSTPLAPSSSPSLSPSSRPYPTTSTLSIEFDGDTQMVILRPNRIIRGRVVVHAVERIYVTQIQIRFRAEEVATTKVDNAMHQCITSLFETQYTVWGGNDATAYAHSAWEELDVGRYEFPFVLKFPNVNYPPSIEDPPGFGIRYVWTAHIEGPGGHPGHTSKKINTPYRPIIASPPDKEWVYRTTLSRDSSTAGKKQHAVAQVLAKLNKQCYCPDEPFTMQLTMTTLQSDLKIVQVAFKFRKHHQGRLMVSGGTAQRYVVRDLLHGTLSNNQQPLDAPNQTVSFDIPTRNVSPTFASRHIRVYYDLHFTITFEESHFLKRSTMQCEFAIPLNIANLPNDELMRVPDLIAIQNYTQEGVKWPEFFDPAQPDDSDPPSYTSSLHKNWQQQQQRSVYLTGPALAPYYPATTTTTTPTGPHCGSSNNNINNSNIGNAISGGNSNLTGISGITTVAGCSSAISHQRRPSFPEIGEATLMHGVYSEDW